MQSGAGGGGNISSTVHDTKGFIKLGYPTAVEYVDEANHLVGINVSAPAAALHLQSGVSGTTTLTPSSDLDTKWDGPRDAAQAPAGGSLASAVNTNNGSTLWAGYSTVLGATPQQFNMNGVVTPNKLWTVNIYVCILSGTWTAGDLEFHIRDANGNQYSYTETGTFADPGATFPTFNLKSFTIDGAGTSTGTGTANSIKIGIAATAPAGAYCACTYIEIVTGGSSDIARWNNDGGTLSGKITKDGYVGIGTNGDTLSAMLSAECDSASQIGLKVFGATSQTGDLQQWRSQSALLSRIKSDGTFEGPITANPLTTTDANFTITGSSDATKTLKFELDGATAGADLVVDYRSAADRSLIWTLAGSAGNDLTLSATLTGDRVITIPDVTGTIPTNENANTITGEWTFDTSSTPNDLIIVSTAGGFSSGGGPSGLGGLYLKDVTTGFSAELAAASTGFSNHRLITFPDGSDEVVTKGATQAINNKTLSSANTLRSISASSGVAFEDNTTQTKKLRMVLSGAVGNNDFKISTTAAREYTFPDTALTVVGLVATANLTAQSAAKTSTTLYAVPSNGQGLYEVAYVATVTTAASTSSVLGGTNGFQLTFTDPNDSVAKTSNHGTVISSAGNTTATTISGVFAAYCKASTNLQYAFDYTSVGGTAMQYDLRVTATFIG